MGKKPSSVRLKRIMAVIIVVIMVFGIAASVISVAFAAGSYADTYYQSSGVTVDRSREEEVKNPDIVIEGNVGYGGKYCLDTLNPVNITVINNGDSFEGEIGIKVFTQDPNESSGGEYAWFSRKISLESGESENIRFDIYMSVAKAAFLVRLRDENGNTVKSRDILSEPVSIYNGICAVVGADETDREQLSSLNYTTDNYYYTVDNAVFIEADELPEKSEMLNGFCAVIFRNGSYGSLSDSLKNTLRTWVSAGGNIIADDTAGDYGTGESYNEAYSVCDYGIGHVYTGNVADNEADGGLSAYKSLPIKKSYINDYDYLEYNSSSTPLLETGMVKTLFIILIIYVAVIGPVIYILLKKTDKRSRAIILIPAASVAFVLIINAASRNSVYKNGIVNVYSRLELKDDGRAEGNMYISFKTASDGGAVLTAENLAFTPHKIINRYYQYYYGELFRPALDLGTVYYGEDTAVMDLVPTNGWKPITVKSDITTQLDGGIDTDFYMDGNVLKGSVSNNTGLDLTDVVVTAFNTGTRIEALENGETEEVELVIKEQYTEGDDYYGIITKEAFGIEASRRNIKENYGNVSSSEGFKIVNRINILQNETDYSSKAEDARKDRVKIVAFNGDNLTGGSFKADGKKTMEFYENIIVKTDSISYDREASACLTAIYFRRA